MQRPLTRALAVGAAAALAASALIASAPTAAAAEPDAAKAANYLVTNLPSPDAGAGIAITTALGLASTGDCSYAPTLRRLAQRLENKAKGYLFNEDGDVNQARAANMAIAVTALGLNPRTFAGYDLLTLVKQDLPADGQIGPSKSAFSQSLGIIALDKGKAQSIPVTMLTNLLSQQDDSGAFGYTFEGTFTADPDTTGLSLVALDAIGELDPQVASAVGWAKDNQTDDGYWEAYSPVDSTGLLGSALEAAGENVDNAKTWLGSVQHEDGGFPNSLDAGTASDAMTTANALLLISGKTALDVSIDLSSCAPNPASLPASTTSCTGVWVVVDRGNGQATTRCATSYSTGLKALKSAGLTVGDDNGFVNRINGYPYNLDATWSKYWGYWYANPNPDGSWGEWQSYNVGAAQSAPKKGAAEGWYYGGFSSTSALKPPPAGYSSSPTPTISGTAKYNKTLTAKPGTWTPKPTLKLQWYRSGKAISKATKTTYKLTKSDIGKTITVKVTASGSGLQTVAKTSKATAKVAK